MASSELRYAIKIAVRQGQDKMQAEPTTTLSSSPPVIARYTPTESFGQVQRTLLP